MTKRAQNAEASALPKATPCSATIPPPDIVGERYVYAADWRRKLKVTDRCIRDWISRGLLPPPDGRLGERNFWLESTVKGWERDCLAGKFDRRHMNFRKADAPHGAPSATP